LIDTRYKAETQGLLNNPVSMTSNRRDKDTYDISQLKNIMVSAAGENSDNVDMNHVENSR